MMTATHYAVAEQGFRIVEDVLSYEECDSLLESLSNPKVKRGRAGARHLLAVPQVASLASDPRLLDIAQQAFGSQAFPYRATLFEKSGRANWLVVWHQDTALPLKDKFNAHDWGPWSEKDGIVYAHAPAWALSQVVALRIHLDSCTNENGPLRVVPHSHTLGVLTDHAIAETVKEHGFIECNIGRGGVLVMRPLLIHSSSKTRANASRRVLHIEYANSLSLAQGIDLAIA
jgi:ectoine hydroxylase-related dioxygenase (phytanoyl-CoA dioxygenase family)